MYSGGVIEETSEKETALPMVDKPVVPVIESLRRITYREGVALLLKSGPLGGLCMRVDDVLHTPLSVMRRIGSFVRSLVRSFVHVFVCVL